MLREFFWSHDLSTFNINFVLKLFNVFSWFIITCLLFVLHVRLSFIHTCTCTYIYAVGRIDISGCRVIFWDLGGQEDLQMLWEKVSSKIHACFHVSCKMCRPVALVHMQNEDLAGFLIEPICALSVYWKFQSMGQCINWNIRMLYLMAAEKNTVARSIQNSTATCICGLTVKNGAIPKDEVSGASFNASFNVRKAEMLAHVLRIGH